MLDVLTDLRGDLLGLDAYDEDFARRFGALRGADAWKLERLQDFHEPENPSWMRYRSGEVHESLRMLEEDRTGLVEMFSGLEREGTRVLRVRVVEWPLTPYLHWELHSLHVRAQCGEHIRVVGPEAVAHLEGRGVVPEVLTLGDEVTYRIRYDERGVLAGSVRHTDPGVTARCREEIAALYRGAEPLESYFPREVAPAGMPRA
ncbi:DUF6879 family protein [Nocardiopsis quinghaiensis]|uniref:DUF6879 family protein n=1 Tax=Nocardiopsis quinghaiensis TaxID=464995 RepID=UPI00123BDEA5|nr:DUF6879 family protein [Nocardiopsis quinghaiensis]